MPLTSPGNDDDTGENHQPTLRKNTAEPVEQTLKQNIQNGIGLRTVSPTTWTVMLEGAHARMTQSFRLRDRSAPPVIQPDRTW